MERPDNCTLVIFGASGDLARRKLIPALYALYCRNFLPERFAILGTGRSPYSDESFRKHIRESIEAFTEEKPKGETLTEFSNSLFYHSMDTSSTSDYKALADRMDALDRQWKLGGNIIFYLAIPPQAYESVVAGLGNQDLHKEGQGKWWRRILIEKPFGRDLDSAQALNRKLQQIFHEDQIYRIDHYLGKETVQNIIAFRFANGIFEPLWNQKYIDHVEVTAAEQIGIENRGRYYDEAGALRDMVQNHLLQVVGTIAMEPPPAFQPEAVRNETVKVFQSLRQIPMSDVEHFVLRGQYTESVVRGQKVAGYREEADVAPQSRTETYVALKFYIDNWRWGGVPFYIRCGKRLPTRVTEAVIHFKKTPHILFSRAQECDVSSNQLILRIQPDEGILLNFGMKVPGTGFRIQKVGMEFHYSDLANVEIPEAYERLLLDCMLGDATLYARSDAVEACWAFVDPLWKAWESNPKLKVYGYPAGTWGPKEARGLFNDPALDWRYPCKNLTSEGTYCEL